MNSETDLEIRPRTVLLIGVRSGEHDVMIGALEQQGYRHQWIGTFHDAQSVLSSTQFAAVILDLDTLPFTNQMIQTLSSINPEIPFLCTSHHRYHPELRESFHHPIYACLNKPVDPDELRYWLKSLRESASDSRGPPS